MRNRPLAGMARPNVCSNMKLARIKQPLRISLSTMLVAVTILCVWLDVKVRQVERQKEAALVHEIMGEQLSVIPGCFQRHRQKVLSGGRYE